jgi:catechol 2,3-dioxygenase-like lactoylglutathione lyase family enzyme
VITGLNELQVITFFVEDLPAAKAFYRDVFGLQVFNEDDDGALVKMQNLLINLLVVSEAPELIEPKAVASPAAGTRLLLTIEVDDVDQVCAELDKHGVKLLNGPIDRPWGRRTAAFPDPAGNVWEVAQVIGES